MDIVLATATLEALESSWIADSIKAYIDWLEAQRAAPTTITRRIPGLIQFGTFARERGAEHPSDLIEHREAFVTWLLAASPRERSVERQAAFKQELQVPLDQMLRVLGHLAPASRPAEPTFSGLAAGFFDYLREERGLSSATVELYRSHLVRFQNHLVENDLALTSLAPANIDGFINTLVKGLTSASLNSVCSALRHLLRWLYRQRRCTRDLSGCVGKPQTYRLATIPRSIPWDQVQRTLAGIDQHALTGKRDFAMLTLLVLYGLRAREVAALTLDDIDWTAETLRIPRRKCGHSTSYPLSPMAGNALVAYLEIRPKTEARRVFIQVHSPFRPVSHTVVSKRAARHLLRAGVEVRRPGSHTLRHSCAQHLLEADFALKTIGDYLGHSAPSSTEIYAKVAIESLRIVALGNGEEALCPARL